MIDQKETKRAKIKTLTDEILRLQESGNDADLMEAYKKIGEINDLLMQLAGL